DGDRPAAHSHAGAADGHARADRDEHPLRRPARAVQEAIVLGRQGRGEPAHMKTTRDGERGQVLILAALLMAGLMGMLTLVIDVGNAYAQRRFVQNAADAASLAAARYLAHNPAGASDAAVAGV